MITIIAKNQTAGDIYFEDLGQTVPASGQLTLTESRTPSEIQDSTDLTTAINADNILLNNGTMDFDKDSSIQFVKQWSTKNPFEAICLQAPDGGLWNLTVDNEGILTTESE